MKIYSTLQRGEFHTHYCEDFLINEELSNNQRLIAVMDGCSTGKETVFSSILFGKILRSIAKKTGYKFFVEKEVTAPKITLENVLKELFDELKIIRNKLDLEFNELLSTLILGIVNPNNAKAEIIVVGDGLVCVDGKEYHFEQEDKPDYLGYHLNEDFNLWFEQQKQRVSIEMFHDLSISTDGIYSFKNLKNKENQKEESEIIQTLLKDIPEASATNFLDRKLIELSKENQIPTDDLAILRLVI
ncbi:MULTISPECIES: protein phosphatase 2C domain-containing protein [unclassified Tenacibaculum]|uniref:protein phosphatase 2C domain-containing protein n=1 Tax=unclassified Tenacibaculum TaxID=2635139 RepID=UPI001F1BEDA7|nr:MULTISPECIES: protein phosphatase 2C domain-containing protein [unclassified Tenacibaculum]MCF2874814.1 protein phosphatase 2C domain-containing protein [Tenacibaculum sp. Cn5-1]MCF2934120.1 protein phosphatase 2C domain-containing protein [Tenacibaculum sp. Cn5-34]MCG7510330.1 protein phosphatase 2C domain-containing protein [Tenacibaculum sp. Cn5-46]